ncbi:MAG: hypothetical protein ACJA0Q_001431 [Saprospiraceae bacterium]|jgi:hypothetical protein
MDLSRFSKAIKILSVVPLIIGSLIFIEIILPEDSLLTIVDSKSENYRLKTDKTTYTIKFENTDDQFTEEIYNAINKNDSVLLKTTALNKQVSSLTIIKTGEKFLNETGENIAIFAFGVVFVLSGFSFLIKGELGKKPSLIISIMILISIVMGLKML